MFMFTFISQSQFIDSLVPYVLKKKYGVGDEVGFNKIGWEVQKNVSLLIKKKKKIT